MTNKLARTALMKQQAKKLSLLEHYAHKEPQKFLQVDSFYVGPNGGDCVMHPDEDGDCIFWGETTELMHGANVRVLIRPETTKAELLRSLKKIRQLVKSFEKFETAENQLSQDGVPF